MKPIVPSKDSPRWLYEILRSLGQQTEQHATALAAVGRGEAPDGSGSPLIVTVPARVRIEFRANGPFRVDTDVDGQYRSPTGFTISSVYLRRKTAGTSGSTTVDVNRNGISLFTTQANRPSVTAAGGNDQSSLGYLPDIRTISTGDIITLDIDAVEAGNPRDLLVIIEGS